MSHTISFFPTSFPKKKLKSEPMPGAGMWKKCNYHMMFIKNLNNYCWRHAFVTLFTYNLQWLDRLIAVSRYLRYAAFNIVKNVMSHNIVLSYRCNTLHHHTISLPLLFDTQIYIQINKMINVPTIKGYQQQHRYFDFLASWWQVQQTCPDGSNNMAQYKRMFVKMI